MKENGMEKLIELLNEYEKLNMCRKFDSFELHTFEDSKGLVDRILEDTVISRRYGFIKWLVDNDKIGRNKNSDRSAMIDLMRAEVKEQTEVFEGTEKYEWYIMLLSIQDNPIEFLVSVLK